jgi:hypothetical protein
LNKPGKYGTLFLYRIRYQGPDPCQGEITYRDWAYSEEHAQLKWDEYNFMLEVARAATSNYLTCKVIKGISCSILDFEGTDQNDLGLKGYCSLILQDHCRVSLSLRYDSVYLGKGEIFITKRLGEMTVDYIKDVIVWLPEGKVIR